METKSTIWITGANGFVGSAFCRHLARGDDKVIGLVRNRERAHDLQAIDGLEVEQVDVGNNSQLEALAKTSPPTVIVHCAASVGPERRHAELANIGSVKNILALASAYPFYLIHVSTISVYNMGQQLQIDESAPLYREILDENLYGTTKAIGDLLVQDAMKKANLSATILRPGAIMGVHPSSTWSTKVPMRLKEKGASAMPIPYNSPMPWLMIESFCHALDLCLQKPEAKGQVYNLFDEVRPWGAYLKVFSDAFGFSVDASQSAANVTFPEFYADRIRRDLGYSPMSTFEKSLQTAVDTLTSVAE